MQGEDRLHSGRPFTLAAVELRQRSCRFPTISANQFASPPDETAGANDSI